MGISRKWWTPVACLSLLGLSSSTVAQSTNSTTVAVAEASVAATSSDSGVSLFTAETLQLTDDVVASISDSVNDTIADLFAFADNGTDTVTASRRPSGSCKVYLGDSAWPSTLVWKVFNLLLGGQLITTTPSAAPCHKSWSVFDTTECDYISGNWSDSWWHSEDPTSVMCPYWTGLTCVPTDNYTSPCTLGGYPSYSVNVSTVAQIQLAVNFARNANIRLVVKNTGHDFSGKSAGAGALNVWTHNLKEVSLINSYSSENYSDKAVKFGSGIQAREIYSKAKALGVTVVGGEGASVGVGGGFLSGGGHSPLSPIYGLASDQVLAIEVVTPDGRFVTASPTKNADLFWGLRGAGGATFGVVTSWIVKAHPVIPVSISSVGYTNVNISTEVFWDSLRIYYSHFKTWAESGIYTYVFILPLGSDTYEFLLAPIFAPNKTASQLTAFMQPWYDELTAMNITVSPTVSSYTNFYDAWNAGFALETVGYNNSRLASRLWPRNNFVNETLRNATADAIRASVEYGNIFIGFNIKADATEQVYDSAVNPAWRNTYMHAITSTTWPYGSTVEEIIAVRKNTTYGIMDKWRALSPGAGSYFSEGDPDEPNFQQAFYGTNYNKLYDLKQKYDPYGVFYTPTGVGSEDWYIYGDDGQHLQNNKLCKV